MTEIWFCFIDVKYYDENPYVPRHGKMICRVHSIAEALEEVTNYVGDSIEEITFTWAGHEKKDMPKQELFFSESEFAEFNTVKHVIEHDQSYRDSKEAAEKYKRKKEMELVQRMKEIQHEKSRKN